MRPLWFPLILVMSCAAPGPPEISDFDSDPVDPRANALVTLNGYHPWTPPATMDEWSERRKEALYQLRVTMGLELMPPRPAPASHERLIAERDGYSVRAIRIESLPGHWVTGNLYLPAGDGPFPAVLCPHGHWPEGRFTDRADLVEKELASGGEVDPVAARYHLQARCVHLVRMGCLVLHYDMVGYADATALDHGSDLTSAKAQLWGVNHLGLQTWNSMRLVDHLAGRPDVDPSRIGVTGGSGGGTQSFMLAAMDERIRVAFPAVMVGTEMQGGCVCENAPHLRVGTSNIGICALIAPRALGMTGADDWTLHIEERGLPELKQVWRLYDRADAVQARCFPQFGHNYNAHGRAEMYHFLARHLELGETPSERPFEAIPPAELSVYSEGDPRPPEQDATGVLNWWREEVEASLAERAIRDPLSLHAWKGFVRNHLRVMLHTSLPADVLLRDRREVDCEGGRAEMLVLARRGSDSALRTLWVEPLSWNGEVRVVASATSWRERLDAEAWQDLRQAARASAGDALLLVDTLGVDGSLGPRFDDSRSGYEGYTTGYNRALIAERVHDLLTAIAHARSRAGKSRIHLVGLDRAGPWAVLAAAISDGSLSSLVANRSWEFAELRDPRHPDFLPGALRLGDMTGITAACAPLGIEFTDSRPISFVLHDAWEVAGAPPPRVAP